MFSIRRHLGEEDIPIIFNEPNHKVIKDLSESQAVKQLLDNLSRGL